MGGLSFKNFRNNMSNWGNMAQGLYHQANPFDGGRTFDTDQRGVDPWQPDRGSNGQPQQNNPQAVQGPAISQSGRYSGGGSSAPAYDPADLAWLDSQIGRTHHFGVDYQ